MLTFEFENGVIRDFKSLGWALDYAFPGGYPKFLVMSDSECLCLNCAKENYSLIVRSTGFDYFDGWQAYCVEINWESEINCAHCGEIIETAYEVE